MRNAELPPGILPKIAISAGLIALVVAAVHLAPAPAPPYKMVDEVVRSPDAWEGKRVRLHGWIKPGSIVRVTNDLNLFTIQRGGLALRVWHAGPVPDTLRDGWEVIATGRIERERGRLWLASDEVMGKCATRYEGFPVSPPERFR